MDTRYNNSVPVETTCCYCVHLKLGVIFMAVIACLDCIFRLVVLCLSLYDSIDKIWENYSRVCKYAQCPPPLSFDDNIFAMEQSIEHYVTIFINFLLKIVRIGYISTYLCELVFAVFTLNLSILLLIGIHKVSLIGISNTLRSMMSSSRFALVLDNRLLK